MPVNLTVCARTDVGLVRRSNEDAFVVADLTSGSALHEPQVTSRLEVGDRGVLLAVADGLGGHAAGEVASALVVESLRRSLSRSIPADPRRVDAFVEDAAQRANRAVWQAAHAPGREHMGTTLTAVFVRGPYAHIAEVGDSRAYLLRGGVIQQVTRDQSYVQMLIDSGVSPHDARRSPFNSVVLQAMGTRPDVKVALGRLALRQHDCLIVCSDGLSNKVGLDELRWAVLRSQRLDAACAAMVDLAKQRGGDDNITVIVAGVGGDLPLLQPRESLSDTFSVIKEFDAESH